MDRGFKSKNRPMGMEGVKDNESKNGQIRAHERGRNQQQEEGENEGKNEKENQLQGPEGNKEGNNNEEDNEDEEEVVDGEKKNEEEGQQVQRPDMVAPQPQVLKQENQVRAAC